MSDNDGDYQQEAEQLSTLLLDNDPAGDIALTQSSVRWAALRADLLARCTPTAVAPPRRSAVWIWSGAVAATATLAFLVWVGSSRHGEPAAIPVRATPVAVAPRPSPPTIAIGPVAPRQATLSHETVIRNRHTVETIARVQPKTVRRRRDRIRPARPVEVAAAARRRSPGELANATSLPSAEPHRLVVIVNSDTTQVAPEPKPITIVAIGPEVPSAPKGYSLTVVAEKENN